jgi:uncharacterized protein YcfL
MKWIALLSSILLASCSFNDSDDVANMQVMVPSSPQKANLWGDTPSIDVTEISHRSIY